MLISPPSWVNSTIRLSAAATQSMFSVPELIEIRAPDDSANHSSGTRIRSARSSAAITRRALRLGQRAQRLGRVAEQHHPGDALRVPLGRRGDHAGDDRRGVLPLRPVHRHQRAVVVEVVLGEGAVRPGEQAGQLVRVDVAAAARRAAPSAGSRPAARSARSAARRRAAATPWLASKVIRTATSVSSPVGGRAGGPTNWTSSSPAPAVVGRTRWTQRVELVARSARSAARRRS